jgi:hypothetical protein
MTHLDTDVLAEFRAGLITGRRGAKIAAHLAGCDHCTVLDDKLAGVSVLLASVPAPPMPDSVAQRLEVVLAAEVTRRNNYAERGEVDRPGESAAPGRSARVRDFRLATWRVLVPVGAAVVLLAGGGYGLSRVVGGPGSPTTVAGAAGVASSSAAASSAGKAASRAVPPETAPSSPAPSVHPQLKSPNQLVNVSSATLRQRVETELRKPRASLSTKAASPRVLGCVRLLTGSAPLELVQSVRFEGQPATLIVARTGQGYSAWVAGPNCSATSRDVLDHITLPSGISAP